MPSDAVTIGRFLTDETLPLSTRRVIEWQFGFLGGFRSALFRAISLTDEENLKRLSHWRDGTLGEDLRAMGLDI